MLISPLKNVESTFDEGEAYKRFFPLTLSRPSFKLIIGAMSNIDRFKILTNSVPKLVVRNPILDGNVNEMHEGIIVLQNFVVEKSFIEKLLNIGTEDFVIKCGQEILAYSGDKELALKKGSVLNYEAKLLNGVYDLIKHNKAMLFEDLLLLSNIYEKVELSSNRIGKYPIISNGSFYLEPDVVIDTREGPVFIGDGAYIQAFSRIEGPSYIGSHTTLVTGSNIRRSYIGKHCTIGGEVTNSIILDYTSSRHQSYIGDSYIGEWVNVGAHTVVSNLKNTYGEIKFDDMHSLVKTGMRKLGVIVGDHVKKSISAMIFSGLSVGFSSNILYFLDRSVPSFTLWSGFEKKGYEIFLESAIETAKRFMESKKVTLGQDELNLFKKVFEFTEKDRKEAGIQKAIFKRR